MDASLKPLPSPAEQQLPFWAGAREGRVRIQCCLQCGTFRFPDAPVCAHCLATDSTWQDVAPRGVVKAWCRFHRAYFPGFDLPYTVLLVELEGGARIYSNWAAGSENVQPAVGMALDAVFEDVSPEVTLLKFRPAG